MLWSSKYHTCLECDQEFENELNIAICPDCLKKEKANYKRGVPSKFETVNLYLRKAVLESIN
ncbi:MAG: hypothetical protein KGD63_09620 [Candidatus Lokiarchaeota archaeon]|nr:hypothetical protein [Candidatus Lokiarchaeota archaeon]